MQELLPLVESLTKSENIRVVSLETKLREVEGSCSIAAAQSTGATIRDVLACLINDLKAFLMKAELKVLRPISTQKLPQNASCLSTGPQLIMKMAASMITRLRLLLACVQEDDFMTYVSASHELTEIFEDTMQKLLFGNE